MKKWTPNDEFSGTPRPRFGKLPSMHPSTVFCCLLLSCAALRAQVVINEIHYNPVELPAFNAAGVPVFQGTSTPADLTDDVHEFIELRNAGGSAVSLSGWRLSGGISFDFTAAASIPAGGFLVVAKTPARITAVYPSVTAPLGPWPGGLSNREETVQLRDGAGNIMDSVSYESDFPWPGNADGLGADQDFTLISPTPYQYKGCSLERVSATASGNDPANWLASPLGGTPTPGAANTVSLAVPRPVATTVSAVQNSDDAPIIRATQQVRVACSFSSGPVPAAVEVQYWVDDINAYGETKTSVAMMQQPNGQWTALVPGRPDRTVVRYRIRADRGAGLEAVSPRADDPAIVPVSLTQREAWHSWFVAPARSGPNEFYDVFVSSVNTTSGAFNGLNGLAAMNYNITGNPKRVTSSATSGLPRALPHVPATAQLWNGSVPCIFVHDGVVRDAHLRYHGSRYNRSAGRNSFKLRFADNQIFNKADSVFITDKNDYFTVAQGIISNAGFPMSHTRWISWHLNNNGAINRLEQGEYNGDLLEQYHDRIAKLNPGTPKEAVGEFYKSTGTIETGGEGPYGRGDFRALPAGGPWTALDRYAWTYALQNHAWKGSKPIKDLIDGMWTARGDSGTAPRATPNMAALRAYFDTVVDVETELSILSVITWMCPWDDTTQNHFMWRRANGKWSQTLWDMDALFGNGDTTGTNSWIYLGENATPPAGILGNNGRGPNFFKDSFFKAYRTEYNNRLWIMNNTFLHPDNMKTMFYRTVGGTQNNYYNFINGVKAGFCEARFSSINTQLGKAANGSDFTRPVKPVTTSPSGGATALPPAVLTGSAYTHSSGSTAGVNAHAKSKWEIRTAAGTWLEPVFVTTSPTNLTTLPIPFEELPFGTLYFWRVSYLDGQDHPSLISDEASFAFGPPVATGTTQTILALDATTLWKYNATAAFNDDAWKQPAYDDSGAAWTSGAGPLGFETSNPLPGGLQPIRTPLPAPNNTTTGRMTIYFRKKFTWSGDASTADVNIRHWTDDGVVYYLNGTKLTDYNMAQSKTTYNFTDLAASANECSEQFYTFTAANRALLINGENTLAAEVHQTPLHSNGVGSTSSDVVFATEIIVTFPPGTAPVSDLAINEVMADNRGAVFSGTSTPDYIELKNNGATAIDLTGHGLTDDILVPQRFVFPAGTMIAAGERLVVWCDDETSAPGLHIGFGLDNGGQRIVLTNGGAIRDFVAFGPQVVNLSLGRIADGTGTFALTQPTPGAANVAVASLGDVSSLRINEWMARPGRGEDWFELHNTGGAPVALSGIWLSDTPSTPQITRIPSNSFIGAGGFANFTADGSNDGTNHANFRLASGGESLVLSNGAVTIHSVTFGSQARNVSLGWLPDGTGALTSFPATPSKNYSNWLPATVVISEALANSTPPLTDYIELHNPGASPAAIGDWWLSDDRQLRRKFQIPAGTVIPAGGFLTFTESQFGAGAVPFALGSSGDEIVLTAVDGGGGDTGLRAQVSFGASAPDVSFGRVTTATAPEFWAQTARTMNGVNQRPLTTPVVINEIHYHPPDIALADNTRDEFIELWNDTAAPVDISGWKLKGDSDFLFPAGTVLPAGGRLLVLGFDPAAPSNATLRSEFLAQFSLSPTQPLAGPFSPKLPNDTASVELAKPGTPAGGVTPFILVDKVEYADDTPWIPAADGGGFSLQRISCSIIGNDPTNWSAAAPTPGALHPGQMSPVDSDSDGIPDAWETANGLSSSSATDASTDNDADGATALEEYLAGTDPGNASSVFRYTAAFPIGATLTVPQNAGRTLTFQYSADLKTWTTLEVRPPVPSPGTATFIDPAPFPARRCYRVLVSP